MQYMLIGLLLSLAVNVGGGWLIKNAWQNNARLENEYADLQAEYQSEIEIRDRNIARWQAKYELLRAANEKRQQRLVENQRAKQAIELQLSVTQRRLNAIEQEAAADFRACLDTGVPADYLRELLDRGPASGNPDDTGT